MELVQDLLNSDESKGGRERKGEGEERGGKERGGEGEERGRERGRERGMRRMREREKPEICTCIQSTHSSSIP